MTGRIISLSALLRDAPPLNPANSPNIGERGIGAVFCDSREASKHGSLGLFVCIAGAAYDGHDFARAVYDAGCRVFAVSHEVDLPRDAICLVYENTRIALALLSASFYGHPSRELSVIGVTGTKGKTTTCLLAQSLLLRAGIPTGYIGTSGIRYADRAYESPNTTPESLILQRTMREMLDCGIRVLVMEVSSQALMQHRVHGISFAATLFTNLSRDHVGPREHPSFEHYRDTKRSFFTDYTAKTVILNADDPYSAEMFSAVKAAETVTFSVCGSETPCGSLPAPSLTASETAPNTDGDSLGISFLLSGKDTDGAPISLPAFLPLPGACNVRNALAALMICRTLGVSLQNAAKMLRYASVAGRCEAVPTENGVRVLIDYAHNGASLREILTSLRVYAPKRLIVLFGSVGGRTQERRREMGAVASELADFCILSSDNPDREPPERILAEIAEAFVRDCPHILIPDRREAILYGLSIAETGDILLLAGKGHESYQLVSGEKLPFSEREIVEQWVFRTQNA